MLLNPAEQRLAMIAAAQFLSHQQNTPASSTQPVQLASQHLVQATAMISPSNVIGYHHHHQQQQQQPQPQSDGISAFQSPYPVHHSGNYYSQTRATAVTQQSLSPSPSPSPLPQRQQQHHHHQQNTAGSNEGDGGVNALQYLKPRADSDAVTVQVAAEEEQREKEQERLRLIKWGRRAEADQLAARRTDIFALGAAIQCENEERMSELEASRLQREADQEARAAASDRVPIAAAATATSAAAAAFGCQAPPPPSLLLSSPSEAALAPVVVAAPALPQRELCDRDLVLLALDIEARQLLQNHVVVALETLINLFLGIVLLSKVYDHLL